MVLTLIVFGECIVIGDIGIECSGCGCDRCGMGDVLGMRGGEGVRVVVSFKVSFMCSVSFTCVLVGSVLVGVNAGDEGLRCMRCFLCRYFR